MLGDDVNDGILCLANEIEQKNKGSFVQTASLYYMSGSLDLSMTIRKRYGIFTISQLRLTANINAMNAEK